jgi:hypothetical protein
MPGTFHPVEFPIKKGCIFKSCAGVLFTVSPILAIAPSADHRSPPGRM